MQNVSIKKLSILSLVLMGASAVTAAVMPKSDKKEAKKFDVGSLTLNSAVGNGVPASDNSITCEIDTGNVTAQCNYSDSGATSADPIDGTSNGDTSSTAGGPGEGAGQGNTSDNS